MLDNNVTHTVVITIVRYLENFSTNPIQCRNGTRYRSLQDLGWKTRQTSRKWNCPLSNGNSIQLISKIASRKFEDLWFRLITWFLIYTRQIFSKWISRYRETDLSFTFILSLYYCYHNVAFVKETLVPKSFSFIARRERKKERKRSSQQSYQIHPYYGDFIVPEYYYSIHPRLLFPEEMATSVAIRLRNDPVIGDDPNFWTLVRDSVVINWDVEPCNLDRSEIKWSEPSVLNPRLSTRPNPFQRPDVQ